MAAINFPSSPTLNQEVTVNSQTWIWNGVSWNIKSSPYPDQTGHAGHVLITDGTNVSWDTPVSNAIVKLNSSITITDTGSNGLISFVLDDNLKCTIDNSGWINSIGDVGWKNTTYSGGLYMQDVTWIRTWGGKSLYVANAIAATGNITAYYSDMRLKTKIKNIENSVSKLEKLNGFYYINNELANSFGYIDTKVQIGCSAQEVEEQFPEIVSLAPFDMGTDELSGTISSKSGESYKTIDYAKLVPVLIEAIKELNAEIQQLKLKIGE